VKAGVTPYNATITTSPVTKPAKGVHEPDLKLRAERENAPATEYAPKKVSMVFAIPMHGNKLLRRFDLVTIYATKGYMIIWSETVVRNSDDDLHFAIETSSKRRTIVATNQSLPNAETSLGSRRKTPTC
jgi:hypothetical protein